MKTRLEIINEAKRIRAECRQIICDAEYWNQKHPTEKPIDPDPNGVLKRTIAAIDKGLEKEIRIYEP